MISKVNDFDLFSIIEMPRIFHFAETNIEYSAYRYYVYSDYSHYIAELFLLLLSPEMMNVALTRARKARIFFGYSNKVKDVPQWKAFIADAQVRDRLFTISYNQSSKFSA